MDQATRTCLPFDPTAIPVLGDPDRNGQSNWIPGRKGAEKVLAWMRRQTLAVTFVQPRGDTADDLVCVAPPAPVNLLGAGGPIGRVKDGDRGEALGFPAAYGKLLYQDSNLYPGGLLCQPPFEFVIAAIAVRPKQLFRATGGAYVVHAWMEAYQARAQQAVLEGLVLLFARNRETCEILGDNLPTYPTATSNGNIGTNAPNSLQGGADVRPLCVGLPVGAESASAAGATPDASLTAVQRPVIKLAADRFANTDAPLTEADPLVVPLEFQLFGYCRCRNPQTDVCQPGGYTAPRSPLAAPG